MLPHPHDLPASAKVRVWSSAVSVYVAIVLGVLVIVAVFGAFAGIDQHNRDRVLNLPERHGQAVVTGITLTPGRSGVWGIFQLRVGDKEAKLQASSLAMTGDTVRVTYREDGQGDLFVQSIDDVVKRARR